MKSESGRVDLSSYDNRWYNPGSGLKRLLWYYCNLIFVKNRYQIFGGIRKFLLRLFGAKIGQGVVIKPGVNIKYPWFLQIGDHVWIGEGVWIDNLAMVKIGDHVCISQGALLLTGNHDYKKSTFDLMTKPINLETGSWVGAKSTVAPGVNLKSHAVLTAGSVASSDLQAYGIYQGNPAELIKERSIPTGA